MARRLRLGGWSRLYASGLKLMTGQAARARRSVVKRAVDASVQALRPPPGPGDWLAGAAIGSAGARRWRLYRPPGLRFGERVPLLVMLHGCGQDAKGFATSTRMNRIAAREGFMVLYPEQDRLANLQGCWNWFDTERGRADGEVALIMAAVDQVALRHAVDHTRVALAGFSAGASMAALLAVRHPGRFCAVVMHSGMPPGSAHSALSAMRAMRGHRAALPTGAMRAAAPSPAGPALPPLLVVHGRTDTVVAASNGRAAAQAWAAAAGATAAEPRRVQRGKRHPMVVTDFRVGARTTARLVEIDRLGHAWSGGAAGQPHGDAQGPDASRLAWAFIARQFALNAR